MKVMKRVFLPLLVLALCLGMAVSAFAASRLVDNADLLSASEEASLLQKLDEISVRQNCDVVILTVPSLDGSSATAYADDYYDANGYGYGSNRSGILFLISMDDRDWAISTTGSGITAFTDAGQAYIIDQIRSDLSDDDFNAAFQSFATLCDDFLTQANKGTPYDRSNLPKEPTNYPLWILVSLALGCLCAFIPASMMKSKMNSVAAQKNANAYVRDGSMNVTQSRDAFLYHTVTRTEKPKETSGGSSTHTGSSGTTHGGSSGKF